MNEIYQLVEKNGSIDLLPTSNLNLDGIVRDINSHRVSTVNSNELICEVSNGTTSTHLLKGIVEDNPTFAVALLQEIQNSLANTVTTSNSTVELGLGENLEEDYIHIGYPDDDDEW